MFLGESPNVLPIFLGNFGVVLPIFLGNFAVRILCIVPDSLRFELEIVMLIITFLDSFWGKKSQFWIVFGMANKVVQTTWISASYKFLEKHIYIFRRKPNYFIISELRFKWHDKNDCFEAIFLPYFYPLESFYFLKTPKNEAKNFLPCSENLLPTETRSSSSNTASNSSPKRITSSRWDKAAAPTAAKSSSKTLRKRLSTASNRRRGGIWKMPVMPNSHNKSQKFLPHQRDAGVFLCLCTRNNYNIDVLCHLAQRTGLLAFERRTACSRCRYYQREWWR